MTARALALALGLAAPLMAQDDRGRFIRGTVTDSAGRPVSFANVMTVDQNKLVADSAGHFTVRVPATGEIGLRFYRIGYEPKMVTFGTSGDTTISVTLVGIPRTLEAVEITTNRVSKRLDAQGFYQRLNDREKGVGTGTFFTVDDIEARNPLRITHMLQAIPGVRIIGQGFTGLESVIRGPNNCDFTLYVDGARVHPRTTAAQETQPGMSISQIQASMRNKGSGGLPGGGSARTESIDQIVTPNAASGIEVYPRGVSAPQRFPKVGTTCGVAVFWTR